YYRLAALRIALPSLHERREDVPLLVAHFFRLLGAMDTPLTPDALQRLGQYPWPGNVRELRNMIDRLRIHWQQGHGELSMAQMLAWLPELNGSAASSTPSPTAPSRGTPGTARPDAATLQRLLTACGGNREKVAEQLGVSRTTLWRWLRQLAPA
ncbi:AAA-type ATPase lid domain-containing protein, partial [Stenotrophomonas sp. P5_B8]